MVSGAVIVAVCAAIGNGLQGWDNAAIAGSLLYVVPDLHLTPSAVGLIVTASLLGSVFSTLVAGSFADSIGRKSVLMIAALTFSSGAATSGWSPSVAYLVAGRSLVGLSIGLFATVAPIFISECSPPEIRGQLATLPQLMGIGAMVMSYAVSFFLSLSPHTNWRLILGIECGPSLLYLLALYIVLPESPRWLVSKGRMAEARLVLQYLRGSQDISGELAVLVEGLGLPREVSLEEWIIKPVDEDSLNKDQDTITPVKLIGTEPGCEWMACPAAANIEEDEASLATRSSSFFASGSLPVDNLVTLMENIQRACDIGNTDNGNMESKFWSSQNASGNEGLSQPSDVESLQEPLLTSASENHSVEFSRQASLMESVFSSVPPLASLTSLDINNSYQTSTGTAGSLGGGWQLMWQVDHASAQAAGDDEKQNDQGQDEMKRVYILQQNAGQSFFDSSTLSGDEGIQVSVLVSQQNPLAPMDSDAEGPAMVHPSKAEDAVGAFGSLKDPGVTQALVVGVGLQVLQQACGINAVLYYTPTILMASGAGVLENYGLTPESSSMLASGVTALLMLPCIFAAMLLMDSLGRRQLLLWTTPVIGASLAVLVFSSIALGPGLVQSACSLAGVTVFCCAFVMGLGPIPNIICSEIFPTPVRGLCIGLCGVAMWVCNIAVSQAFPLLQARFGLGGVFAIFCTMSVVSWLFVFLKVPETKGLPLEVICDIFSLSARGKAQYVHED